MPDKVNEAVLYSRVKRRADEQGWFFRRVENACDRGTPDLFVGARFDDRHLSLWVECKTADAPKSEAHRLTGCKIREDQCQWHKEFLEKSGVSSWFLFQIGSGAKARRYLVPAYAVIHKQPLTEAYLQKFDCLKAYPIC